MRLQVTVGYISPRLLCTVAVTGYQLPDNPTSHVTSIAGQ